MTMGNNDERKSSKSETSSSPTTQLETQGSSDGSYGNTTAVDGKPLTQTSPAGEMNEKNVGTMQTPATATALELHFHHEWYSTALCHDACRSPVTGAKERELWREKRKQANREPARRSRSRKQAETEELARKVDSLTAENATLRSKINQLNVESEKLYWCALDHFHNHRSYRSKKFI